MKMSSHPIKVDGYVRVSRVAGREGENFISPDVQRSQIEAYASVRGWTIAEWHEDLDVSGGTMDRPGLKRALERCASGETGGIVAAKLDRLSRSLVGLASLIERSREENWTLVAVDFGLDVKAPGGQLVANILGSVAQWERERRREDWDTAQASAVRRGIHVASRIPTGYTRKQAGTKRVPQKDASGEPMKNDDGETLYREVPIYVGPLLPDEIGAPVIAELFRRRASGDGWSALARFLDESGIVGPYSNSLWSPSAVQKIVRNRVYMGEARSGKHVHPNAHDAIVTRAEWEAAQGTRGVSTTRKRADDMLLTGLIRCASCRYVMKADTMKDRGGNVIGMYRCRRRHSAGMCPRPATVLARVADPYVEQSFLSALADDGHYAVASAAGEVETAARALTDAEFELAAYRDETLIAMIGFEAYRDGLAQRALTVDEARESLGDAQRRATIDNMLPLTHGSLVESWPNLTTAEKRRVLANTIDAVVVRPSRGAGKLVPVGDRTIIVWHGEAPNDLPRKGRRVPLAAWDERPDDARLSVA